MNKTVLLYNLKANDQSVIEVILASMNIEAIELNENDCQQEVGALAKLDGYERVEQSTICNNFNEEFIFMCNLDETEMDELSKRMKEAGISFKGIKAMLTKHNKDWRLVDLFNEVMADHQMFNLIDELQKLIKMSNVLHKDDFESSKWASYESQLMSSYLYFSKKEYDLETLQRKISELKRAMNELHE